MADSDSSTKINLTNSQRSVNKATYVPLQLPEGTPAPGRTRRAAGHAAVLGDKGFASADFEGHLAGLGALLVRPDRKGELRRFGSMGRMRQWVQSAFDTLKDQLGLERHGGRTLGWVFVRVAQRLLALAACICWNWQVGAPIRRSLVAYDH
jgi:hypothetical protein